LGVDASSQANPGHAGRHGVSIGALGGHRVIRIGNRDDSRDKRNLVLDEAVWVAAPIDALVMMADDTGDFGVILDIRKDALPDYSVLFHLASLVSTEWSRLF